jgi:predicted nucleic acid-binding protein
VPVSSGWPAPARSHGEASRRSFSKRNDTFGSETSARNSEVIHAGLYYPSGSLKAALCVAGRRQLYEFCSTHGVSHRRCGKLIVATSAAQDDKLAALQQQGELNGVDDLRLLSAAEARALEPELACTAALLSPSTGIIDSHGLMLALLGDAEREGASCWLCAARCTAARSNRPASSLRAAAREPALPDGDGDQRRRSLGPGSRRSLAGFPADRIPASSSRQGQLLRARRPLAFSRLVYPLPETGGLGVHLTLDLGGQARFGPDVEWLPEPLPGRPIGRSITASTRRAPDAFYAEIRRYWPGLPDAALAPAYAGIRPKIAGRSEPPADFLIQGPAQHGIAGLVNLFGIESPGLTACSRSPTTSPQSCRPADPMRAVLDTNIVIDLLHFADPQTLALQQAIARGTLHCFTDRPCLAELQRVCAYPQFGLDAAAQGVLLDRYASFVAHCEPDAVEDYPLPRCRDADDQKFLILGMRCRPTC